MRPDDARPLAPSGRALLGVVSAASAGVVLTASVAVARAVHAAGGSSAAAAVATFVAVAAGILAGTRAARVARERQPVIGPRAQLALGHLTLACLVASTTWALVAVPLRIGGPDPQAATLAIAAVVAVGLGFLGGVVQSLHLDVRGPARQAWWGEPTALLAAGVSLGLGVLLLARTDELGAVARRAALAEAAIAALALGVALVASGGPPRPRRLVGIVLAVLAVAIAGLTLLTGSTSPGGLPWSPLAGAALAAAGLAGAATSALRRLDATTGTTAATRLAGGCGTVLVAVLWRGLAQSDTSPAELLAALALGLALAAVAAAPRLGRRRWSLEVVAAVVAGAAWPRPGGWPAAWAILGVLVVSGALARWFPDDPLRPGPLRGRLPAGVAAVGSLWVVVPEWGPYGAIPPTLAAAAFVLALAPSWRWAAADPTGRTRPLLVLVGGTSFLPVAIDRGAAYASQAQAVSRLGVAVAVAIAVVDARRATVTGAAEPPRRDLRRVPPALAVPGMLWLLVNVTVWSSGVFTGDDWAYAAWAGALQALPVRVATVDGALALPTLLPLVLYVGASLVVEGRSAAVRAAGGLTGVVATGTACGAIYAWGPL